MNFTPGLYILPYRTNAHCQHKPGSHSTPGAREPLYPALLQYPKCLLGQLVPLTPENSPSEDRITGSAAIPEGPRHSRAIKSRETSPWIDRDRGRGIDPMKAIYDTVEWQISCYARRERDSLSPVFCQNPNRRRPKFYLKLDEDSSKIE